MSRRATSRCGWLLAIAGAVFGGSGLLAPSHSIAAESAGMAVEVELTTGMVLGGELLGISDQEVRILVAGEPRAIAVASVRRLTRAAAGDEAAGAAVTVIAVDGSRLGGDRFTWQGETATIERREGSVRLPIEWVRTVVMRPQLAAGADVRPAWMEALPAEPTADLVIVARGDGFELVECAIVEVAADTVTVLLDGERIPVKAGKVLGLNWVRPAADSGGGMGVVVRGGRLAARRVDWSPAELVVDERLRLPGGMLAAIDYAAGRTVPLTTLVPERLNAEPFFASLASDGMQAFFAPRPVRGPADPAADPTVKTSLLVRPRTAATWRVPVDSRRFRATLRRAGLGSGAVEVRLMLDDTPAFSARLDQGGAGEPAAAEAAAADQSRTIDLDVSAARRLSVEVDFVAGDLGGPVRLDGAVFEK